MRAGWWLLGLIGLPEPAAAGEALRNEPATAAMWLEDELPSWRRSPQLASEMLGIWRRDDAAAWTPSRRRHRIYSIPETDTWSLSAALVDDLFDGGLSFKAVRTGTLSRPMFGLVYGNAEPPRRNAAELVLRAVIIPRRRFRAMEGGIVLGLREDQTTFLRFTGAAGALWNILPPSITLRQAEAAPRQP